MGEKGKKLLKGGGRAQQRARRESEGRGCRNMGEGNAGSKGGVVQEKRGNIF